MKSKRAKRTPMQAETWPTLVGHWREMALGEVIELKRGYDLPKRKRIPGSVPLVSSSGISDYHTETKVQGPGVVTGRYGTLGEVYFVPDDFWPLNTTLYVRDFKGNAPRFIAYLLKTVDFSAYSDKAAVPGVNRNHLHQAPVRVPPLPEQRAIAHILGTLDDKIELNRQMNETLEEMARAIFKDWFIDFGPTRAKMEGREPYLPVEVWGLFPDNLLGSELGAIPEGWEVEEFGSLLDDVIGGDWGKENPDPTNTEAVSIIRGTDIPSLAQGGTGSVPLRYTTERKLDRRRLRDGDIIIEVSGGSPTRSTGRSIMVTDDMLGRFPVPVVCASFCRRFRPRDKAKGLFASQHLDFLDVNGKMWQYQLQSTGIANFQTKRFLEDEKIVWPSDELIGGFSQIIEPIVRRKSSGENLGLANLRDRLLPELVSGKLQVTPHQKGGNT